MDFFSTLLFLIGIIIAMLAIGLAGWSLLEEFFLHKRDPLLTKTPPKRNKALIEDKKSGKLFEPLGYEIQTQDKVMISMTDGRHLHQFPINPKQIVCRNPFHTCFGNSPAIFDLIYDTEEIMEEKTDKEIGKYHHDLAEYYKSFEEDRVNRRVENVVVMLKAKSEHKPEQRQ